MTGSEYRQLIREDLYRYAGSLGAASFRKTWRYEAGFRLTFLARSCRFFRGHAIGRFVVYPLISFLHHRASVRHGVHINPMTEIGGGLYLPHALNIVVNTRCIVGKNCNISQGVTLGVSNRGDRAGVPTIGDQVYLGPGSVVFGAIKVSDQAAIGANCVVTRDVPERGVVVGVPGKVISTDGSEGYINQILRDDPDQH